MEISGRVMWDPVEKIDSSRVVTDAAADITVGIAAFVSSFGLLFFLFEKQQKEVCKRIDTRAKL